MNCNGYQYRMDKRKAHNEILWRCLVAGCHGRYITSDTIIDDGEAAPLQQLGDHHHPPCPEQVEADRIVKGMQDRVRAETTSARTIY